MNKLVKHVRDANHVPFATIVAIDKNNIGLAICSTNDRFDKKRGTEVATGRAMVGVTPEEVHIPHRNIFEHFEDSDIMAVLAQEVAIMRDRATRYFK